MLKFILAILNNLMGFKAAERPPQEPEPPKPLPTPQLEVKMAEIDWTDHKAKVSEYFSVHEALWLPTWNRLANESDGLTEDVKSNLVIMFKKLDLVRSYLGKPILVHVAFRPTAYNTLVKGAKASSHLIGKAVDWHPAGLDCDKARELLEPCLEQWGLRMEKLPNSNWIHNDCKEVPAGGVRYFIP